jgi:predicted hydrolase (HD superfamily)
VPLYRFAGQHFMVAREWNDKIQDIILVSGRSYTGKKEIKTPHGLYNPLFVDLTEKDGFKRLEEIKKAVDAGDTDSILELIFIPLYGRHDHKTLVESVLEFELTLCKQEKITELLIAATLIMANKIIDQETFQKIWKELKMINIFAFAHEKGREEGREEGKKLGTNEGIKEMLFAALEETIEVVPGYIVQQIEKISNKETLKSLFRKAMKCTEIQQFEKVLVMATAQKNLE